MIICQRLLIVSSIDSLLLVIKNPIILSSGSSRNFSIVLAEDEFNLSKLQEKYQVFKVISVDDNRKGNLPHYKIGVSE